MRNHVLNLIKFLRNGGLQNVRENGNQLFLKCHYLSRNGAENFLNKMVEVQLKLESN